MTNINSQQLYKFINNKVGTSLTLNEAVKLGVNKEYIEEATIIFMRNIQRSKKHEHDNKTRNIKEK